MDIKNWLTNEKNLELSHLEIFNFEKTGRGVRATRDILENEEIISIPYEILITKDFCTKNVEELKKWIYFLTYFLLSTYFNELYFTTSFIFISTLSSENSDIGTQFKHGRCARNF